MKSQWIFGIRAAVGALLSVVLAGCG
ncbi:MAG: hypothetical protein RI949_1592, partial [Pseudomonadota bacterium]